MTYLMSKLATLISTSTISYAPWEQFRRPYVRDLAFILACPNVLTQWLDFSAERDTHCVEVHSSEFWLTQFDTYFARLKELDTTADYQELTRYLLKRPSPNRLGFHFEGLLSFWLSDGFTHKLHGYEILASNTQLFEGKQTIGELDLILRNHNDGLIEHWELAIKFFMGSAPFTPAYWVGISSNDNLKSKMTYMHIKQFRTVCVDTENHGQVKINKRYAVIKGRFFLPINTTDFSYPNWLSTSFPMHEWCDENDKTNLATLDRNTLRLARYIEWFTKRDYYDDKPALAWSNNERPNTGLYFEGDRPVVIYPKKKQVDNQL